MQIFNTLDKQYLQQADVLLYSVLWEPYGLPRDTRNKFEINGVEAVFVAVQEDRVIAAFVLITKGEEAEIRHAAVHNDYQGYGIGKKICDQLLDFAKAHGVRRVEVFGRNTAIAFWESLGFESITDWLDYDLFAEYGIRFKKMVKNV